MSWTGKMEHCCRFIILACLAVVYLPAAYCDCGYQSCNPTKPDRLNVHIVPHTHDDVGWLKTVDQYFYGANNSIQHAGVQYIIDSVVSELDKDPKRRFIYVEMAFFERWWREQNDATKEKVTGYVNEGRLEFINGGWSMNDEACTHYSSIIDQMTLGHRFLKDTFGKCGIPKIAWHIDPFGHSREQASLFAQMAFDGFLYGRISYLNRGIRIAERRQEIVWRANPSLGKDADIFSGLLFLQYAPPLSFCYDVKCNDPPISDDKNLFDYNVDERVDAFVKWVTLQSLAFQTNHIMLTMGSDFQYENANAWYKNLDKLMKYVNAKERDTNIYTLYSTPSCYTYNLNKANKTWTTKEQDFFPYADSPHSDWSGYFVSRVAFKGNERRSNNLLQVCKQLEVLAGSQSSKDPEAEVETLKEYMGVSQHHDSITGTAKQHVNDDYTKRLHIGNEKCQKLVGLAVGQLMAKNSSTEGPKTQFCNYLNISMCPATENADSFAVILYNPIGRNVSTYVKIPVNGASYHVAGPDGSSVTNQVQAVSDAVQRVRRDRGSAKNDLFFFAHVPALGFATYQVTSAKQALKRVRPQALSNNVKAVPAPADSDTVISTDVIKVTFDSTGLLKSMTNMDSNVTVNVKQSFYWYNGSAGNHESGQASGAYIFRPNSSTPMDLFNGKSVSGKVVKGSEVIEFHQTFQPWLNQIVRLYKAKNFVEFEWVVGPIPFMDGLGKEIITKFDTDIDSEDIFYTDSNGRQMMKRQKNHREDYPYVDLEPVAGNYYPINSRIFINDKNKQFTIMTDRSEGGSSLKSGSVELMVHRRLLHDDGKGVGEPLNETGQFGDGLMAIGKHRVLINQTPQAATIHRELGEEIYMAPWVFFSSQTSGWNKTYDTMKSFINMNLPRNVHLLTLELWAETEILIRLEHMFEKDDDPEYSKNVTVSLKGLFPTLNITGVDEHTLSANQELESATRLQWHTKDGVTPEKFSPPPVVAPSYDVMLSAMQIRTFIATFNRA
ncbi:lysosomal alpha-mannosidase-like isoform X3 [Apostichopus japonicus]|uniref:lysosomal alpha-mannosidase-like isoform X3 n=1 Tax=Stichopus japonicus TaxID=307972 RepID=UPI003AB44663